MAAKLIDGKKIADEILEEVASEVKKLKTKPKLALVRVGEDAASKIYLRKKEEACARVGIISENYVLPESASEREVIALVEKLNRDPSCTGILVQLPLPKNIGENKVIASIAPEKDVDGFHPINIGRLLEGDEARAPCTPSGIIALLGRSGVKLEGKRAVVVGRSMDVGKPVAVMLLNRNATVTICHSRTRDLGEHTRSADVLVVAVGKPKLIGADMVKEDAVVIDVGQNRVEGKVVGDVDFERVKEKASLITPVPGGVGPMTVAILMRNTVNAQKMRQ